MKFWWTENLKLQDLYQVKYFDLSYIYIYIYHSSKDAELNSLCPNDTIWRQIWVNTGSVR